MTSTTIGQVLLAYAPPDLLEKVLANEVRSMVEDTVVSPQRLRALLADVRRTGAGVFHGHGGWLVVAVPVDGSRRRSRCEHRTGRNRGWLSRWCGGQPGGSHATCFVRPWLSATAVVAAAPQAPQEY